MKQYNTLFGMVAGVAVAFSGAGAYALDTDATVHGQGIYLAMAGEDDAVIGGDAPNPEPDRSVSTTAEDATITAKVKASLLADSTVGGLKIDVDTRSGVVYLTSENMNSQAEIDQAVQIAQGTEGVKNVVSKMSIGSVGD